MLCFRFSTLVKSPIKFSVKSSLLSDSRPSTFSILSMLFRARFKYSNFFNFDRFSIFAIRLFCKSSIFRSRHQLWIYSIFSMSSWWRDSSSRVPITSSLCSDFLRMSCSVTERWVWAKTVIVRVSYLLKREIVWGFKFTYLTPLWVLNWVNIYFWHQRRLLLWYQFFFRLKSTDTKHHDWTGCPGNTAIKSIMDFSLNIRASNTLPLF